MTWFRNMKIASKLIFSFLCVAIIAGIVGLVGVLNLYRLVEEDTRLYEYYTVPLQQIGDISIAYQKTRVIARDATMEKDLRSLPGYIVKVDEQIKIMKEQLAKFNTTLVSEEGRKNAQKLETAIAEYDPYLKRAFGLMQAGHGDQAYNMARTEGVRIAATIDESIDMLSDLKVKLAKEKADNNREIANKAIMVMIAFLVAGVSLAIGLGLYVARAISRPVGELVDVAGQIAAGDLNVDISVKSKDEIGQLSQAFRSMAENINRALTNIDDASEQVSAGAHQVAAAGQALSQGSTEQASSIEEITASMTQVAAQTKHNAVNANQANELALAAKEQAQDGNSQMQAMVKAMAEINDASGNISKIIKVIDEIAFQTNILALNAAVEAARAGQHGKGFAVVAEEVRNLAARSANAAKETTTMIEGSIKKVEVGTKIANDTAEALDSIVERVSKATELVGNIAEASNEQATAIAQINQAISQVSQVVQTNSATAEESAAASEELSGQAEVMKENVRKFRLKPVGRLAKSSVEMWNEEMVRSNAMDRKRQQAYREEEAGPHEPALTPAKKIVLDDREFGKY